jgi:ferritin-like metal-binding protein YciE
MGVFTNMKLDSLECLLVDQVQDLYDAEQRLTKALPQMAKGAHNTQLKNAIEQHLRQTQNHVNRLERVFQILGKPAEAKTCDAMKGLISEGGEILDAEGDPNVIDAAIIAAAQRVEHYEMAGYGTARALAKRLGRDSAAQLLQETLEEEKSTDKKLTELAEQEINLKAARA